MGDPYAKEFSRVNRKIKNGSAGRKPTPGLASMQLVIVSRPEFPPFVPPRRKQEGQP
jgi:hypothetical protein